ncbi:hypothetical protein ES703_101793 [subsurface metagenome]
MSGGRLGISFNAFSCGVISSLMSGSKASNSLSKPHSSQLAIQPFRISAHLMRQFSMVPSIRSDIFIFYFSLGVTLYNHVILYAIM